MSRCSTANSRSSRTRSCVCPPHGQVPGPIGARHPSITPFAAFPAADGSFVIAAGNDASSSAGCAEALGRPELPTDARFARNGQRSRHHDALRIELEQALRARAAADWVRLLREAGIACGPVNDVAALRDDPQVRARHMLVDLPLPGGGALTVAGCPVKFDAEPPSRFRAAPQLDQHRGALLAELGLTPG